MTHAPHLPPWADAEASRILPQLCDQGEGQTIEFKERLPSQGHDIAKSIAAFASTNDGYLIYGVSNDGRIVGLSAAQHPEVRDEHTQRIIGSAKAIRPPVHPTITWALYQELVVCVVRINKGNNAPYYSNQRPMVRRENVSRPAEPDEVEQIIRSSIATAQVVPPSQTSRQIGERMRRVLELMNSGRLEPNGTYLSFRGWPYSRMRARACSRGMLSQV
jgi:predicted HTH transcriptional regulator